MLTSIPDSDSITSEMLTSVERLTRDLRTAARTLSDRQARFLVNDYYRLQKIRISASNQTKQLTKRDEPAEVLDWIFDQFEFLENQIRSALDLYTREHKLGAWPRSVHGIGPVLTAGLVANTHMEHLETAGNLLAFSGMTPGSIWSRGEKRPWNAALHRIGYLCAESFVKFRSSEKCFYGRLYDQKKAYYAGKNEARGFALRALEKLKKNPNSEEAKYHKQGLLSPGHIELMTRRWTSCIFFSHYWEVSYWLTNGCRPPAAYAIGVLGHVDYIPPINFEPPQTIISREDATIAEVPTIQPWRNPTD